MYYMGLSRYVSATSNFAGAVDIGAANGIKITEGMKVSKLENDNAVDRKKVTEQTLTIEWEQNIISILKRIRIS